MKTKRLLFIFCFITVCLSALALVPKTETNTRWMRITDVERTDSTLRVGVRIQHYPHNWVKISPAIRLMASSDTTFQYKLIATENIELGKEIWMPESGYHYGVLIFEKVPEDIKVVDLVETEPADFGNCTYGIRLDEPNTSQAPTIVTFSDILKNKNQEGEPWTGLDPKRYSDISFYDKEGMAHLKGKIIDYSPRYGGSTFTVRTKNDFTEEMKMNVGNINPDGTFALDIPLAYPQYDYLKIGEIARSIFLIPGDTLSIVTSMAQKIEPDRGHVPEFFGFEGDVDDGVVINLLADSIYNKYNLHALFRYYRAADTDSMKEETYKISEKLAALLDSVYEDLPSFIGDLPISVFAKDILTISAIGQIWSPMEESQMDFRYVKGPGYKPDEDGKYSFKSGEILDESVLLKPWMKYKDLMYNNPIMVCHGWVLPNRWRFNDQFRPSGMAAEGMEELPEANGYISTEDIKSPYTKDLNHLDSIGLGNCFVAQFVRTVSLIDSFHTIEEPSTARLERNNKLVANVIKHNEYDMLNGILMEEYNGFVKDIVIAENLSGGQRDSAIMISDTPDGDVLAKIIEPYKGNVLFLDFWGIGCGPCRSGMVKQKPLLEELADKPFKALYIANASDGLEACKKWLRKEEIKGEHIFVSGDDWQRLSGLFNFSGIPFGVLIDKEGKILKTNYYIEDDEALLKKALQE